MKRSTLEQKNSKNENEILEQFPTFATDFDWNKDLKTYDFKTYYEDGWKITEARDKERKSILIQKSKIKDGACIEEIEYFQNGKRIYHSQKMEGVPKVSYNATVEKSDKSCLILTLISLGALVIIILVILGIISLF